MQCAQIGPFQSVLRQDSSGTKEAHKLALSPHFPCCRPTKSPAGAGRDVSVGALVLAEGAGASLAALRGLQGQLGAALAERGGAAVGLLARESYL